MSTQAKTGQVDGDLVTWLSRVWGKTGAIVKEIAVGHQRSLGSTPITIGILTAERMQGFKDSRELGLELESMMRETAREFHGKIRFEINMWGGESGSKLIASKLFKRQGEGEPELEDDFSNGTMTQREQIILIEHGKMFKATVENQGTQIATLERQNARLHEFIDRLYEKYPALLDLMEGLADRRFERDLRWKGLERTEKLKGKAVDALMQFGPALAAKFLDGTIASDESKLLVAAPHLKALVESLKATPESFMQILALMNEDQRKHLLSVSEVYDQVQKAEEKKEESEIKVRTSIDQKEPVKENGV